MSSSSFASSAPACDGVNGCSTVLLCTISKSNTYAGTARKPIDQSVGLICLLLSYQVMAL
ncbi:hypothetical protein Syun_013999 [Stephania yunnanensis]|uniref:Uncharacterized protein n=1 Tax=Stephania yunnanensis TaxID=152371 RepID=A0AAP0JIP9_9MAGN